MTQDEKRVKIAEACGFTNVTPDGRYGHKKDLCGDSGRCSLPDYFADLNACAEMEEVLTKEQQDAFIDALLLLIIVPAEAEFGMQLTDQDSTWVIVHSTAAQRAEAFGRALGLWT